MSPIHCSMLTLSRLTISKERFACNLSLYLIANRPSFEDKNLFFKKIGDAVKGGVTCVQFRDHQNNLSTTIKTALRLKNILKGVSLFNNTLHSFEVVQAIDAEGVYLEENFPYAEARRLLGKKVIIGVPVKTFDEVLAFEHTNAIDYLSLKIGPSKKTCSKNDQLWKGIDDLQKVIKISSHRIVVVGGLNISCAESIYRELRPGDGMAMAGGLMDEEDTKITAQKIQAIRQKT